MNPAQLIRQAKAGDSESAGALLEAYRNYLLLLAEVKLSKLPYGKVDKSDIVQETCLAACRDLPKFRGHTEAQLLAWLRAIMANICLKTVRTYRSTQRRDVAREQALDDQLHRSSTALGDLVSPLSTPSQRAVGREAAVVLADKLAELPDHYRQAIVMHHIEGLTIAQVAQRMDRSPEAANSLLARALVKLRILMKEAT